MVLEELRLENRLAPQMFRGLWVSCYSFPFPSAASASHCYASLGPASSDPSSLFEGCGTQLKNLKPSIGPMLLSLKQE